MKDYLTIDELALKIKVSKQTIYKWVKKKEIKHLRKSNIIRFDPEEVERFLRKYEVA